MVRPFPPPAPANTVRKSFAKNSFTAEASFSAYLLAFLKGKKRQQKRGRKERRQKNKIGRASFGRKTHFLHSLKQKLA